MLDTTSHDLKEQIRQATDIVALAGSYLQLRAQGDAFVAHCPWHDDSRPSLQINPKRQSWKCWPCDIGGDVFSFVMQRENVDFPTALRMLAERAGIELHPERKRGTPSGPHDKPTLYRAMSWAEEELHRCLLRSPLAKSAREYVAQRGISEENVARFRLGFAPNEWQWLLDRGQSAGFSPAVLEAAGLAIKNEQGRIYDRFRGRVIFPIRDVQDRPIAVGGRILPEFTDERAAKYINSPETSLYTKSDQLYGLNLAKHAVGKDCKTLLVVEGYTDVIATSQAGVRHVVAVCGTSLTTRHIQLLRRYVETVTLVLDGDDAGQKRAAEVLELFVASQVSLKIATLPERLDPCDFVQRYGADALTQLVGAAPDAIDFHVQRSTAGIDLANDTHHANQALQQILQTMAKAPRLQHDTPEEFRIREAQTIARLSRMFHVDQQLMRDQVDQTRERTRMTQTEISTPVRKSELHNWERELFIALLRQPDQISYVLENLSPDDMLTEQASELLGVYQTLELQGYRPDFNCLMSATEKSELKLLLVELDESRERMECDDIGQQTRDVLDAFIRRRQTKEIRQDIDRLSSGTLAEEEGLNALHRLIEAKRCERKE